MSRARWFRLVLILIAALAIARLALDLGSPTEQQATPAEAQGWTIETTHHLVDVTPIPAPDDPGRGGSIAVMGDRILIGARNGDLHLTDEAGVFVRIDIAPPFDLETDAAFFKRPQDQSGVGAKDLAVRAVDGGWEVFLTHSVLDGEGDCYAAALSALRLSSSFEPAGDGWRRIYQTSPCLPLSASVLPVQAGGILAFDGDDALLMTVGDLGFDVVGRSLEAASPQSTENDYGKVLRIDIGSGAAELVSYGHRNNAGLAAGADGRVWSTEHGPRGGDELNLIKPGVNYGWPLDTLGTQYGAAHWPLNPYPGRHQRFRRPVYAWVPSIAVSQLIEVRGDAFGAWRGDLLVSSLKAGALRRLRVAEGRIVFDEPISLGYRIRDLVEDDAGRILLLLDRNPFVLALTPAAEDASVASASALAPCAGCHQVVAGVRGDHAGPTLAGVLGRDVAADERFDYSQALRSAGGVWTAERLAAYLADVDAFAPGGSMPQPDVGPEEIKAIIAALGG